jgi:hypothetical protein
MRVPSLFIIVLSLVAFSAGCNFNQKVALNPRKPTLIRQYKIHGTRAYTTVEAEIYSQNFEKNGERIYPQKVKFNDTLMNNDYLDESKLIGTGCPINSSLPTLMPISTTKHKADKSVYSLFQEGYRKENKVTIIDKDGAQQTYPIYFEPVEFELSEDIILSRSKDNVVKLKGARSTSAETPGFGISQQGHSVDEKLLKYDKEKELLIVPAKALRKLKKGDANFFVISSDGNEIGPPPILPDGRRLLPGNSYIISYNDMIWIQIVD